MKLPSQACSAISAAWGGSSSGYSWPTGAAGAPPNWQSFTTGFGKSLSSSMVLVAWSGEYLLTGRRYCLQARDYVAEQRGCGAKGIRHRW